MTPLAHRLAKDLCRPARKRVGEDDDGLLARLDDIHCFDMTEAKEMVDDLAIRIDDGQDIDSRLSFLPAPKTWIEWDVGGQRHGYLLIERPGGGSAEIFLAWGWHGTDDYWTGSIDKDLELANPKITYRCEVFAKDGTTQEQSSLYAALALINSPRIIGRRQHMPHRGLERRLVNAMKPVGKFPLHAWTEIKLEIAPPRDLSDEESKEAHLTGRKALHFCRAHLRIRRGQLEFVRSHWRGDAFLGIKQSRYRVVPARSSTPAAGGSASVAGSGHQASDP